MATLTFFKEFSDVIINGKKKQTIRRVDKPPVQPGDPLYLFMPSETGGHHHKLRSTQCETVQNIFIDSKSIMLGNELLPAEEQQQLAAADGFHSVDEMRRFIQNNYSLPFIGVVITWL